jgi:hypothetical protein
MHNFTMYNLNYVRSGIEEKKVFIFSDFVPLFTALDSYIIVKFKKLISTQVSVDCNNGGKVTFQFSYAAGNNNGTSVEDGQIPEIIFYT